MFTEQRKRSSAPPTADLSGWSSVVGLKMPHLSKPQARVLALWSYGMVVTKSMGLTTVSSFLALLLGQQENTLRQRLREFYRDAKSKKGKQRRDLDVRDCFAPLLKWVLALWPPGEHRVALALDATTLGDRFTVLAISVVYRGCAIPVAWEVVRATSKGSWKGLWLGLLDRLSNNIPQEWEVLVLADRGLYASWLYSKIVSIGWHPFLRVKSSSQFRAQGQEKYTRLGSLVPAVGTGYAAEGVCFKSNPLECTLLGQWEEGYEGPWFIVTDLKPQEASGRWYAMRSWIECSFKQAKRGGWQWQNTKMTDPERAARMWLTIAVATLWVVSVGSEGEDLCGSPAEEHVAEPQTKQLSRKKTSKHKLLSTRNLNDYGLSHIGKSMAGWST